MRKEGGKESRGRKGEEVKEGGREAKVVKRAMGGREGRADGGREVKKGGEEVEPGLGDRSLGERVENARGSGGGAGKG